MYYIVDPDSGRYLKTQDREQADAIMRAHKSKDMVLVEDDNESLSEEEAKSRASTPHEDERAEAAVEIAEAAAELNDQTAEALEEHATELEEAVGVVEDAIPEGTDPAVKLEILTALEDRVAAVEAALALANGTAEEAEVAAEVAEEEAAVGDAAGAQIAAEVAVTDVAIAQEAEAVATSPAPDIIEPQATHPWFRPIRLRKRQAI